MGAMSRLYGEIADIAYGKTYKQFCKELKKRNFIVFSKDANWENTPTDLTDWFYNGTLYEIWEEANND